MLRRDYVMRMVEMLAAAMKKILQLKEEKKYDEAISETETEAKLITGIDLKLVRMLSINDILFLLKTVELDAGKCIVIATLLKENADIFSLQKKDSEAMMLYLKSLRLFLEALTAGNFPGADSYFADVDYLLNETKNEIYSVEILKKLLVFYEERGFFAKAEDMLFELMERNNDEVKDIARNFYKRLLEKDDEDLRSGNLSRKEILESIEEIRSVTGKF